MNRGTSIEAIIGKLGEDVRIISGDPLTGEISKGYLGFYHSVICGLPETKKETGISSFSQDETKKLYSIKSLLL